MTDKDSMTDRDPTTNRQRLLTILDGGLPDRIPWIPRIRLWYRARKLTDSMPARWKDLSLREVERLLRVMQEVRRERLWPVIFRSPAKLLLHGAHLSSRMTPPPLFDR